jgi:hypothetical protein
VCVSTAPPACNSCRISKQKCSRRDDFRKYRAATKLGLTEAEISRLIEDTGVCEKTPRPRRRCIGNAEDDRDEIVEIEGPAGYNIPAVTTAEDDEDDILAIEGPVRRNILAVTTAEDDEDEIVAIEGLVRRNNPAVTIAEDDEDMIAVIEGPVARNIPAVTELREEMARIHQEARMEINDMRNELSGESSTIHSTCRNS